MVQPNYTFRASTNPDERRAVEDAAAKSILWGFMVGAETDGRVLVDDDSPARRAGAIRNCGRHLPGRSHAKRDRYAMDEGVSEEHGS
jgi:hypothetical protein